MQLDLQEERLKSKLNQSNLLQKIDHLEDEKEDLLDKLKSVNLENVKREKYKFGSQRTTISKYKNEEESYESSGTVLHQQC